MNHKERLRHLASVFFDKNWEAARSGICLAARETDGIVIVAGPTDAKYLSKTKNVDTRVYDVNLNDYHGPFYLDPMAVDHILKLAADKIESLEADKALLELKIKRLESL